MPLTVSRDNTVFDLCGVVNHAGALGRGHYTAVVRSRSDGKWRLYNDARVTEVAASEVQTAGAYLFFYERRDAADADVDSVFPPVPGAERLDLERELQRLAGPRCAVM